MQHTYAEPPKLSAIAMTSFIVGLVSLCTLAPAPVAFVLGIVGIIVVARSQGRLNGMGFAITGVICGLLASIGLIVVALMFTGFANLVADLRRPVTATIPPYETFYGQSASGSGFHFEWEGERFIACSLHQFDGEMPDHMLSAELERVPISGSAFEQMDVQILRYRSSELDRVEPLRYVPGEKITLGHPVVLLFDDEEIVGNVIKVLPDEDGLLGFSVRGVTPVLNGASGSPVLSGLSGNVIGVLIPQDERRVYFEPLDPPRSILASP